MSMQNLDWAGEFSGNAVVVVILRDNCRRNFSPFYDCSS